MGSSRFSLVTILPSALAALASILPVPVNFKALRNPRRDMVWVAAAGPSMNLVLATLAALTFHFVAY
jgi:Zn-dependent protease